MPNPTTEFELKLGLAKGKEAQEANADLKYENKQKSKPVVLDRLPPLNELIESKK